VKSSSVATHVFFVLFISLLLFGIIPWNFPALAAAQSAVSDDVKHDTPGQVIKQGQSLHIDVDLALVNVTVTDPYDRLVTGLEPDNFRVFENNIEQEIQYFSSEDIPISIGVIFDISGSMTNKVGKAKEAALQFFKTANQEDEFFLVGFNERAELLSTFTTSVEDLQSHLLSASAKGRTALLDAIYLGLSKMRTARNAKRALLIISDGGDNRSRYHQNDIKRLAREADTQLYSVGIFDPLDYRSRTPEELNGPSLLSEVTELTGGRAFELENVSELSDIAEKIGAELRNTFWATARVINRTTPAGAGSRSSCGPRRGFHLSASTQNRLLRAQSLASLAKKCSEPNIEDDERRNFPQRLISNCRPDLFRSKVRMSDREFACLIRGPSHVQGPIVRSSIFSGSRQ
jgi:Ca-activated chloride channel family protein